MGSLVPEQHKFALDLILLFNEIDKQNLFISPRELRRNNDPLPCVHCGGINTVQEMLVKKGVSWTLNSRHLESLAIDIILFRKENDNSYKMIDAEDYKPFGDFWESLSMENIHSLRKGWDTKDIYHFERKIS
jgi:hypothetical protein